ncbi:uncharacterized protein [Salminus brasiliensis]|uniref:uncharacterized protein n=1 Tax=Salminus brasiliensis TaxID=930266 RepID=UPI003B833647
MADSKAEYLQEAQLRSELFSHQSKTKTLEFEMLLMLLVFTGASNGLITIVPDCRITETSQCYGALGRPLYLQLSSEYELSLKKNSRGPDFYIFRFKNQTIRLTPPDPRWQFVTENRTMIISRAEKDDSGNYCLEIFNLGGRNRGKHHFQLIIEAMVSSLEVADRCFSKEKRRVACSSDGDQLSFSWTLIGITPIQERDGNKTLLINKHDAGYVICNVENHISRESKMIELHRCAESTADIMSTTVSPGSAESNGFRVFVSVWLFEVIVLVSLLVGAFYIYTRIYKKQRAAEGLITVGSDCRITEMSQCYGALGRPLYLQLPSESELNLRKNIGGTTSFILRFRDRTIRQNPPDPRWQFVTENRTMIISRAEKDDSGRYSLETFDLRGTDRGVYHFLLIIEGSGTSAVTTESPVSALSSCTQSDNSFRVFVSVWLFEVIILVSLLVGAFYIYTRIYKKQRAAEGKKRRGRRLCGPT